MSSFLDNLKEEIDPIVKSVPDSVPTPQQIQDQNNIEIAEVIRETANSPIILSAEESGEVSPSLSGVKTEFVDSELYLSSTDYKNLSGRTIIQDSSVSIDDSGIVPRYDIFFDRNIPSTIEDRFRYTSQKIWTQKDNNVYFLKTSLLSDDFVPYQIVIGDTAKISGEDFDEYLTPVELRPKESYFTFDGGEFGSDIWKRYIAGDENNEPLIEKGRQFLDHVSSFDTPFNFDESAETNTKFFEFDADYNFQIINYENSIESEALREPVLPDVYGVLAHINNGSSNPKVLKKNTLNGILSDVFVEISSSSRPETLIDNKQLFNEWARNISQLPVETRDVITRNFSHVQIQADDVGPKLFDEAERRSSIFPMRASFNFSTDSINPVLNCFKRSNLLDSYVGTILKDLVSSEQGGQRSFIERDFAVSKNESVTDQKVKIWDVTDWWRQLRGLSAKVDYTKINIFQDAAEREAQQLQQTNEANSSVNTNILKGLSQSPPDVINQFQQNEFLDYGVFLNIFKDDFEAPTEFVQELNKLIFSGKFRKLIKNNYRGIKGLLRGQKAYNDTLFFRIAKHRVDSAGNPNSVPVQSFYIPNSDDKLIKFFDTQVKYDTAYVYRVYAYNIIIGNKYEYQPLEGQENIEPQIAGLVRFNIKHSPSVKLAEILYFDSGVTTILDKPPISPEVSFDSYVGLDDRILINIEDGFGERLERPVPLYPEDLPQLQKLERSQGLRRVYEYGTDDNVQYFEMFRLGFKPETYQDFSVSRRTRINLDFNQKRTTSKSQVDLIQPNTKYYYTFRSVDTHNHYSNPTPVYEVELVNNSGAIFPVIKVVELKPSRPPQYRTKDVQKYIKINLAPEQTQINLESSSLVGVEEPSLAQIRRLEVGIKPESGFSRKYKIRLTGKQTGRKIDILFSFRKRLRVFEFNFSFGQNYTDAIVIQANSFSEALHLLLIEQESGLI